MATTFKFEALRSEYAGLWANIAIRNEHRASLERTARRILEARPHYDPISKKTGIPWFVIGIIHQMECGLKFSGHLHNGDSLKARTHQVPKGRPAGDPPFTWEESAIDALTMKGKEFDKINDWCVERVAYCFELYNGFGYRQYHPEVHSAYLWSYSSLYNGGKYIADHVWSATAVSEQPGAMTLLKVMIEIDPAAVDLHQPTVVAPWPKSAPPVATAPASKPVVAAQSKSVWAIATSVGLSIVSHVQSAVEGIGNAVSSTIEALPSILTDTKENVSAFTDLGRTIGAADMIASIATTVSVGLALYALYRHVILKHGIQQPQ